MVRRFLLWFLLPLLATGAWAVPDLYVRNRPVAEALVSAGEYYLTLDELGGYFSEEEIARLTVAGTQVLVDGQPAGTLLEGRIPVLAVGRALGFRVTRQPELNLVDLTPPAALKKRPVAAQSRSLRLSPEYAIARERMRRLLMETPPVTNRRWQARLDEIGRKVVAASERPWVEWHFLSDLLEEARALLRDDRRFQEEWRKRPRVKNESASWREGQRQIYENRLAKLERRFHDLVHRIQERRFYEQAQEEEADMRGMRYAALAGYEPTGLSDALARLERTGVTRFGYAPEADTGGSEKTALQTPWGQRIEVVVDQPLFHPPISRRLQILRKVSAAWRREWQARRRSVR